MDPSEEQNLDSNPTDSIERSNENQEEPQLEAEEAGVGAQEMEPESNENDEEDPSYDPSAEAAYVEAEVAERPAVGKRKRGRPRKAQTPKQPAKKKEKGEEDVCFICFDGGNLVCCDRRGCPKVYHAACINRDESFFQTSGKWNCGWHICSICEKAAQYMCYTCTYSLCKWCIKVSGFVCVRGKKGFCESCYSTVMLIESNGHANEGKEGMNFDEKNSFEYLFRDYWFDVKRRLSLALEELQNAEAPLKGSGAYAHNKDSSSDELYNANDEQEVSSDSSLGHREGIKRKKGWRRTRESIAVESPAIHQVDNVETSISEDSEWASKELLEFVAHMKGGDKSVLSQFEVQALLLEYIKQNDLRDPRRKSQIICDPRLESLFVKARVGHFEMLKLLESHFLIKEASQVVRYDNQGAAVDPDSGQLDAEGYADGATKGDRRRKNRKKFEREPQTNLDDYAAIDVHNISLIFLRRNLIEDLLDDVDTFSERVVDSFVRIRISGTGQKQDVHRLVQVVGISKTAERYKISKKTTDFVLDIVNLNKKEVITIDIVSNQDFTEEECKRLRQSIKYGFISRFTVGDILEKARVLQAVKVNDWLEIERQRYIHLRDRASETGRRKQLRECVERLALLSSPEEHTRRLNEVPEIHPDPKMDPAYQSADEEESDDNKQDTFSRPRDSSLRKGKDFCSPGTGVPASSTLTSGLKGLSSARDSSRNTRTEGAPDKLEALNKSTERTNERRSHNLEPAVWNNDVPESTPETITESLTSNDPNETEKIWNYRDPAGKIQGPFCMVQLRKWNTTGFFPVDMRIWRASESEEDSVLLADALNGRFEKDLPQWEPPQSNYSQPSTFTSGPDSRQNNNLSLAGIDLNVGIQAGTANIESPIAPRMGVVNPVEVRSGISPRGLEPSRDANAWSGQPQVQNNLRPVAPSYGDPYGPPLYQGNGGQGVGNAGFWNPGQDHRSSWSSNNPRSPQPAGHGYGQPNPNWESSGEQSSRNQWENGSYSLPTPPQPSIRAWANATPTLGAQPVGTGWGSMNAPATPTPIVQRPIGSGWAPPTPSAQPMGSGWGLMNTPATPMLSAHPMGTGWGAMNLHVPPTPLQPIGTGWGTANGSGINGGWGSNSASMPNIANQTILPNVAHVPHSQRTDVPTIMASNPTVLGFSSTTEQSPAVSKNQFFQSDCPSPTPTNERLGADPLSQDNMSPIRDADIEPTVRRPEHMETSNLKGPQDATRGSMWSLPSPTPGPNPSGGGQSKPWVSDNSMPPPLSQPQSGWGAPAVGNANPNGSWGTWKDVMRPSVDMEDRVQSGWGNGERYTNEWGTQHNQSVDDGHRSGHGRDSRYDSRQDSYSRHDCDRRHDSRHGSRHGGDSRYDSRYGGDSRHDSRHSGSRSERSDRTYRDREHDRDRGGSGGRSSRTPPREAQGICKFFHEHGHCKKGSRCNYVHS